MCELDKIVRTQEDKLQQLYREKVTKFCTSQKNFHVKVIIKYEYTEVRSICCDVHTCLLQKQHDFHNYYVLI